MKNRYLRVLVLNAIQFDVLAFLFVGLGAKDYVDPASNDLYAFALAAGAGSFVAIAVTLLFYKLVDKKPLRTLRFGLKRKDILFSLTAVLLIAGIYLIYVVILSENGTISAHFYRGFFENGAVIAKFLAVGAAWFLAALNEELADRAYFVANFKDMSPRRIFLFSTLLFAVSHFFKGLDSFYTLFLLLMGLVFMYVYIKTGSVIAASLPHFALNFITAQLAGNTDISILRITDGQMGDLHMGIFSVIVAAVLIVLVRVFYREKMSEALLRW